MSDNTRTLLWVSCLHICLGTEIGHEGEYEALGGVTSHEDIIRSDTVVMMSNFVVLNFFYWNYRMTIYIYSLYITYRNNQEWVSCLCMFIHLIDV